MSAVQVQAQAEHIDAEQVIADAQADAEGGDATARLFLRVVRFVCGNEDASRRLLDDACAGLLHERRLDPDWQRDEPFPWPAAELRGWLLGRMVSAIKCQHISWGRFLALTRGAKWLADAARLVRRDGHCMRQPGGLRLAPSAFDGERLRAEIVPGEPGPGEPCGDVLRITWEDTGRLVVQSMPGDFGAADLTADPE